MFIHSTTSSPSLYCNKETKYVHRPWSDKIVFPLKIIKYSVWHFTFWSCKKRYKGTKITIYLYTGLKKHWQVKSSALQNSDLKQREHRHLQQNKFKNRPLALRGHVTNASFKQWVGILLMPKIDRAKKNYLTLKIWEETHLKELFYGSLIFQQSSMIRIGHHVGGCIRALQHGGQNYFLLISC